MSEFLKILILSIIQGVTEFLPVSSSGHLVIGKALTGLESPGVGIELSLHLGSLVAIIGFYFKDIFGLIRGMFHREKPVSNASRKTVLSIVLATIPIGVIGVLLNDYIESLFANAKYAGAFLIITGTFLLGTRLLRPGSKKISLCSAVGIGLAQAMAILPGISRSGSTIATARFLGIEAEEAARFSFLIAIPAIAGAVLYEFLQYPSDFRAIYIFGAAVSAIVGYFSLKLLVGAVKSHKLWLFGPYCLIIGLSALINLK